MDAQGLFTKQTKTTEEIPQSTLPDWAQERLKALGYSNEQIAQTTDEQAADAISQRWRWSPDVLLRLWKADTTGPRV